MNMQSGDNTLADIGHERGPLLATIMHPANARGYLMIQIYHRADNTTEPNNCVTIYHIHESLLRPLPTRYAHLNTNLLIDLLPTLDPK